MKVSTRILMAVTLLALTAGLCLAKPNTNKQTTVTLTGVTVMPDGGQLQAGNYRMELLNDSTATQVAFYKNRKLVCKCPVKIENAPNKAPYTKALYDIGSNGSRVLKTLVIAGWSETVVFSGPGATGSGL